MPAAVVPQTAAPNRGCLDNSVPHGSDAPTRDVYTHSAFSHASPLDIQKITPAAVDDRSLGQARTLALRMPDLRRPRRKRPHSRRTKSVPAPPRLAFQITAEDRFAIRFRDVDDRIHEAVAADLALQENHWYHTAATSDGRALRLYVDALDGRGYQLRASTALPQTGSTALGKGARRLRVEHRTRPTGGLPGRMVPRLDRRSPRERRGLGPVGIPLRTEMKLEPRMKHGSNTDRRSALRNANPG